MKYNIILHLQLMLISSIQTFDYVTSFHLIPISTRSLSFSASRLFSSQDIKQQQQQQQLSNDSSSTSSKTKPLKLITFDLDDTIFPVGPVVQEANNAMFQTLYQFGYTDASPEGYIRACKILRKELYQPGSSNPITYSELRRRAVKMEMDRSSVHKYNPDGTLISEEEKIVMVEKAFEVWLAERHASAERHIYPDAIDMLNTLTQKYPDICIGAITNGRGNPMDMPNTIQTYFDFCVAGEDEDVFPHRKPHEGIFKVSLSKAHQLLFEREQQHEETNQGGSSLSLDSYCWIHVGDDLANDVGASAACGAKAIWMAYEAIQEDNNSKKSANFVSTASPEEQEARKRMNEKAMASVSAKIEFLSELPDAIESILNMN